MKSKKASVAVWIFMIVVLIILGIGIYFIFFNMSESKARGIIQKDYYDNPSDVCNRFYVSGDKCPNFMSCYIPKAIDKMPKNLLIQFAKDIQKGKSSAIDSYSLISGKEIGEGCISETLNLPEGSKVTINEPEYTQIPEEIKPFLILDNIGIYEFDHSSNFTIKDYDLIMATYNRIGLSGAKNEGSFVIKSYSNKQGAVDEFNKVSSEQLVRVSKPTNILLFSNERTLNNIRVLEIKDFIYSPPRIHNYWIKDNYFIETRDLLISDPIYDTQESDLSPQEFLDAMSESITTPIFDAYFDKYS